MANIALIVNNVLSDSGAELGAANGVATLDSGGKIPVTQLPNSVMEFKGTWSAATNTPTLANGTGNAGDVYEVSAAGTVNFGAGGIAFALGDYVVYDGATWQYSSGQKGTVTSLTFSAPLSGGTITTSGTVSIPAATSSVDGYLKATDWVIFNGKQAALGGTGFVKSTAGTISYDTSTYLTSYTETDTLASVTGRGASTTATITSTATNAFIAQNDGTSSTWRGRILSKNATSDKAAFLGTYGSIAGVFAHNNALDAWADLYVNTVDGSTGGNVRMPSTVFINGNQAIHAGNYSSYAVPLSGGSMTGQLTLSSLASNDGMIENNTGSYFHLGGWGVGRTDATAILVNTAYRADNADAVGGVAPSRIVYGENSTATTSITNATLDGALKSGFYTVGSGGIPNATSVNFVLHTAYAGVGNSAGFDLACNDSTTSPFYLRPATGAGKGSWQTVITSSNITGQSVSYATTAGTASSANAVAWSNVSGKPSTLSGYGIGDAVTAYYGTDINPNTQVGNYTTMTTQSGISGWTHVLSMAWQPSTVANWVSQIGFGAQAGDGAYYRTTSGSINGLGWKRLIDSGNIGSQSVNYATSAGSASTAGSASSAGAVVHNSGRTDSAWYNVGWFASSPSPAYSADGVQIQSSTNSLKAQNLRGNGNVTAGATLVGMGNNDTSFQTINFGISGADYKHKYILLAKVPTYGAVTVNCSINGRITSARVNNLDMNVDQDIMLSMGYANVVSYNTEARSNSQYQLVVYNYGGTNYYALYMYTAPNYYQGTFSGLITNVGGWLDGNFLVVVELNSANHSSASYGQHTSTIMGSAVLHAGNASYAYNMNQNVRTDSTPTFTDVYVNSWFRNNTNATGLYNTANDVHFYSTSDRLWNMGAGNGGDGGLVLRQAHQGTIKGYLFWNSSGFGLLNNSGDWGVRINNGGSNTGGTLYGSWNVNTATSGVTMTLGPVENSRTYNDSDRHGLVVNAAYYPHIDVNSLNNGGNTTHGPVISMTGVKTGGGFRRWGMGIANLDPGYFSIGWWDNNDNPHYGVGHSTSIGGRFIIDTAGNIWCTGDITAYGAQSDARLKTIKGKVNNALDGVLQLNGYRFDWKERDVKITTFVEDIGVIAQEVAEVFPELARVGEDGWMSVRYQGLTAVLIEAVKEQQKQIEELKSIINDFTK